MIPPLPVETLQDIFKNISYDHATLYQAALASKTFNSVVQPILFHRLWISNRLDTSLPSIRLCRQVIALQESPRLYSLIRDTEITTPLRVGNDPQPAHAVGQLESQPNTEGEQWQASFDFLGQLLRLSPIKSLRISNSLLNFTVNGTILFDNLKGALEAGTLQELHLSIYPQSIMIPVTSIRKSQLLRLGLQFDMDAALEPFYFQILQSARHTIQTLELFTRKGEFDVMCQPSNPFLHRIMSLNFDCIESLIIMLMPAGSEEDICLFLNRHPSLTCLRLNLYRPFDQLKPLPIAKEALPRLTSLIGNIPVLTALAPGRPVKRIYASLWSGLDRNEYPEHVMKLCYSALSTLTAPVDFFHSEEPFGDEQIEQIVRAIPSLKELNITVSNVSSVSSSAVKEFTSLRSLAIIFFVFCVA